MNMYGDWSSRRVEPTYAPGSQKAGLNAGNVLRQGNAERLNWVNGKIKAKGGTLMMSFSVRDITDMNPSNITDAKCNEYTKYFEDRLDYAVISNVKTYLFEHRLMYNSLYHPNDEGAALRTSLLTADIKRYLNYLANPTGTFSAPKL